MLAKDFNKDANKLNWNEGVIWQPKLDGVRALIGFNQDEVFLKSRGNKFYHNLNHIKRYFHNLYTSGKIPNNILFDCELYTKELKFEEITGVCRKQKALNKEYQEKEAKIETHIFDIFDINQPELKFCQRYDLLLELLSNCHHPIVIVTTEVVPNQEHLYDIHNFATELGYEGIMLRNINGKYKQGPTRSNDLIKMKAMIDDEFEIVNFKEGQGLEKGTVIWTCITKNGKEFNVRPTGTREQRKIWFKNGKKYLGKNLTVQFQEWSKDKIPRFPVGIDIRDYE
jgi:DNA ligase-1